ncbi:MAG: tetratricopeptide repeat protein [Candidatus Omnitrophica bacterium]|nr:tetratricopeptide repeat protein [Candidatus Omnitrophota bacterium]
MDEQEKKSLSVYLIAVTVILANLVVLSVLYQVPFLSDLPVIRKALPLVSLAAVYPFEFFQYYLKQDLLIHFYWIMSVMISAFGLMLFNRFARTVFIVFNILKFVILGVISVLHFGNYVFWGYFFKCYFNMVAFMLYIGYLTLPEIRQQFLARTKEKHFEPWFLKLRRKAVGPKDGEGYFNLALAYQKLGRMDEAWDFLSRTIAILPKKAEAHFAMGQILFDRHDYSQAIKSFQEAVRIDQVHLQARYLLGQAYQRTGCLEEAVQSFRRCTYIDPPQGEIFRQLGIACYQAGHLEEGEQALLKSVDLDPQQHVGPYYLGLIMMKDPARIKNAEEQLKKAVRLKADFVDSYKELGNLYVGQGDYKAAVRSFRDVLRLEPNQTQAHYQLGFAYAMLKDFDSARREHKILKDMDPDLAQTLGILLSRS